MRPACETNVCCALGIILVLIPCRNNALKDEITALKKKEAEDTKALENMVLKVEENLVTTTVSV